MCEREKDGGRERVFTVIQTERANVKTRSNGVFIFTYSVSLPPWRGILTVKNLEVF